MSKRSIKRIAQQARTADAKARQEAFKTDDSFQNFSAALGIGTRNQTSGGTYGLNPISRQRVVLDWVHRGSWIGGVAVDLVANDMTRAGADILGDIDPEDVEHLERAATTWNIWNAVNSTIKWARLYGGCIAVMMIDGQKPETPLSIDRIGKGAFKGLLVLDRWMITPSLEDLVTDLGPDMGLPKYYNVDASIGVPRMKVHYSRVMRLEGIELPYWQRIAENMWGISVLERLYDRMLAFDSATTGAAQLVYKCYLRTYKLKNLRTAVAQGGDAERGVVRQVEFMRRMQSLEGITLLDGDDEFETHQVTAFGGLSDALMQFGQQLSGALQIPLVRLFGQSPAGLNSTGESDLRTYYDNINNQQNSTLLNPLTTVYRVLAKSEGIELDEGFRLKFRSLWLLNDSEKADIATADANSINSVFQSGVIRRDTALKELKQSSQVTGRFTNISDDEIKEAEQEPSQFEQQQAAIEFEQEQARNQNGPDGEEEQPKGKSAKKKTKDSMLGERQAFGLNLVIEHDAGEERYGINLPAAYGYIRSSTGADDAQMDCFVRSNQGFIFVIDSYKESGEFDEHKVMIGYPDAAIALADFRKYYGWFPAEHRRVGIVSKSVPAEFIHKWVAGKEGHPPFSGTNNVSYEKSSDTEKHCCGICKYREQLTCLNQRVQFDPKVPESWNGEKLIALNYGCTEFEKK